MERCVECGRGGKGGTRLPAPALLTLAAEAVAAGEDLENEGLHQLFLLRKELHSALDTVNGRIDALAAEWSRRA